MKHLIKISLVGFFIFFVSCQTMENGQSVTVENEGLKFPVIKDTSQFVTSKRKATWLSTASYGLLYIGKWKDTIYPDYSLKYYSIAPPPPPPPGSDFDLSDTLGFYKRITEHKIYPYHIDWEAPNYHKTWQEAKISILVDTTQRVKNEDIEVNKNGHFFDAYPVLIKNKDSDTITITFGDFVPLITEAKDSTGNWRPIEKRKRYKCGMGIGAIILPPDEVVLTATMIYQGNYQTSLRLKIDSTFSNEFKGNINYRQFESMFNNQGNFKDEYKNELRD